MTARRPPGWYRDPDDPTRMRHWHGRGWSGRHRSLPAWALSDTEVVPEPSWGNLQTAPGGPVLEGPVRPMPLPAGTRGSLAERRRSGRHQRLIRPAAGAGGTVRPGGYGTGSAFETAPWVPGRRPLIVFCALVVGAVLMMAATVVGVNRSTGIVSSAAGRDAGFVARATSICQAGLGPLRTPATTAMTTPGDTSAVAGEAQRSSAAVALVQQQLRSVPVAPAAAPAVGDWLDTLGRYATDESQLAAALAAGGTTGAKPAAPGATGRQVSTVAGPTAAEQAAIRVRADVVQADIFAGTNALSACSLAPSGKGAAYVPIP
ncbi:hypothetical protein K6U06_11910 [Acidiferrimicrobium sp. IK]|uniref:hypothetical protein n=1 Tax=Acidiferrimicrobium sp. IK TaxID=2871700 RepID=UPI0021CB6988|nr:hypothetical protein [Acidiferrimicrobium sp. IK]MCU4185069.1 hypothetical protein [Acidiferrimicrobium sp. IK]